MKYGYARCSTSETRQEINRQVQELRKLGIEKQYIYKEYINGESEEKSEFNKILSIIQPNDELYATEVSRITRSTKQLCNLIEFTKENHIKLVLGSFILDCTKELDPLTEGMLKMMGVFAELEKNMISQRVKSGMQYAKSKGKRIGRPPKTTIPKKVRDLYYMLETEQLSKKDFAMMCGISRPTLDKYIKILQQEKNI